MHRSMQSIPAESTPAERVPLYDGLRATADEYLALPDDEFRYELIDGVVLMSPSPTPLHQRVAMEIGFQLESYLRKNPVGMVFHEVDVKLDRKLVYQPELVYVRRENLSKIKPKITFTPDLVVEVVSPRSRPRDTRTKFGDYERFGVLEYWLIDPPRDALRLLRLKDGAYAEVAPQGSSFASTAVEGFVLDVAAVRASFRALG